MAKLDVLVFVDWYKPGYRGGGPVRSMINMVDHLAHEVRFHIVTGDTDYASSAPYQGVVPDQWTELPSGERVRYASRSGRNANHWRSVLLEREWDAVYINGMFSLWYSIMPLWLSRRSGKRRIVVARGMLLPGPMGQGALKKRLFLALAKAFGLYRGVEFQATSSDEVISVQRHIGSRAVIHEVTNLPRKMGTAGRPARHKEKGSARLVNVVRIATEKNIHLIIQSLMEVKGEVVFDLYGPVYHEAYWEQCELAIAQLPANIKFNYHGPVASEQVPQVLSGEYHALFMPNEGDNFGHTMVEAMCAGLPLLISDRSPWRGLVQRQAGWDIPLNGTAGFTAAVQELVDMDQNRFDALSAGAYAMGMAQVNSPDTVANTLKMLGR
ncbi:MAG: glycosyltransferase family 4 protein [Flavobacteriales bacterium]|nr:glycosyltransferase family 4 protein [Flavobacteriales bacterium]